MLRLLLSVMEKGAFMTALALLGLTQWGVRETIQQTPEIKRRDHPDRHNHPDLKQNAPEIRGVYFLSKADAMAQ
jgi:hypothetical protein